jgi:hypothetical protein
MEHVMTEAEAAGFWIQVAAVVVAVAASIVALVISFLDRRNAKTIAADDRTDALASAKLMFELEQLLRLLENNNRGGTTDPLERSRMGAEALTLIGLLGQDRVPRQWTRRVGRDDDGLGELLVDDDMPDFKKDAIETQLALNAVVNEIKARISASTHPR